VLIKTMDYLFVDDKEGKPVGIHQFIGRRPIACFGNSDGDKAMLEYTTINNPRPSFGLIVHHTDAEREYAYDAHPKSSGKLVEALKEAPKRGWTVVDMRNDWKRVFAPVKGKIVNVNTDLNNSQWLPLGVFADQAGVVVRFFHARIAIRNTRYSNGLISASACSGAFGATGS
jgi:hypothetical protein